MATSDATWGDLAMEGRFGVFGLWVVDQGGRRAGGLRRLGGGCRGLDGESAGGLRGSSLHSQGSSGGGCSFRALREGWWCSLPMLVPARSADARSVLGRGSEANGWGGWVCVGCGLDRGVCGEE